PLVFDVVSVSLYLHSFPTRRSSFLFFRDLSWRLQLIVEHLRLDLDLYRRLRWWWRGRWRWGRWSYQQRGHHLCRQRLRVQQRPKDRKSTRLNYSQRTISYAVFCLKN